MYLNLFRTFFKIGLFTLGGGYAMIPIIEREVVEKNKWIEKGEFLDILAVSQSCPGALAVNMSVFVGYRTRKMRGAVCTTLGTVLPSFTIILLIAMFFHQFQDNAIVAAMFRGIRPAVVALIAAPTFSLAKSAHISLVNCWIPIVSALLIWLMSVNPIYILLVAGFGGYLYGLLVKPTE
jgi:chromate transporter